MSRSKSLSQLKLLHRLYGLSLQIVIENVSGTEVSAQRSEHTDCHQSTSRCHKQLIQEACPWWRGKSGLWLVSPSVALLAYSDFDFVPLWGSTFLRKLKPNASQDSFLCSGLLGDKVLGGRGAREGWAPPISTTSSTSPNLCTALQTAGGRQVVKPHGQLRAGQHGHVT